ncbi:phosphopantetheine-binding protein [Nocardiopsis valliformis]|uniref:phosphopantetheine-binding protein n=1 Tax=Nocardiopsis valliformis TaxID=239974 RepID=UPI00037B305C|nr:phosphopantetheine-binding protein [Nocardiopsis valliformis]
MVDQPPSGHTSDPPSQVTRDKEPVPAALVAALYARVLKVDAVGESDDFFVLGGTSLSAMDLLDAIAEETGVLIPVRNFYMATGVTELTRELNRRITEPTDEGA